MNFLVLILCTMKLHTWEKSTVNNLSIQSREPRGLLSSNCLMIVRQRMTRMVNSVPLSLLNGPTLFDDLQIVPNCNKNKPG
ncbi:hypothetical protein BDL97_16G095400 [Sphagnum fallax]|uniref:Uncharacterized protein n=2 Tax=Sphagnum jensenii TaxID=128206 RepID=A0ABP1BS19_9BRYO|nr:hypothetical protein BDL97_16G095400 [Sphagnum fallax]